jgi:hypothetical protein
MPEDFLYSDHCWSVYSTLRDQSRAVGDHFEVGADGVAAARDHAQPVSDHVESGSDHAQSGVDRMDPGDDGVDPGGLGCEAGDLVYPRDEALSGPGGDVVNAGGHVLKADSEVVNPGDDVGFAGGEVAESGGDGDEPGSVVEVSGGAEDHPVGDGGPPGKVLPDVGEPLAEPDEVPAIPDCSVALLNELHAPPVAGLRPLAKNLFDPGDLVGDAAGHVDDAVEGHSVPGETLLPLNLSRLGRGSTLSDN